MTDTHSEPPEPASSAAELAGRKKILADKLSSDSKKLSELSRGVGFGLAALVYVFPISNSPFSTRIVHEHPLWLLWLSVFGGVTIILDYLQYASSYFSTWYILRFSAVPPQGQALWAPAAGLYGFSYLMFFSKQLVALIGVLLFCAFWVIVFLFDS
jgi:hypothetical protein